MSLKQLVLEDEPEINISFVLMPESELGEPDPEMPGAFLKQDDLNVLSDAAAALESIGLRIACEGIDLSTARQLEALAPGYIRRNGGGSTFTNRPSLEGLADARVTVTDQLKQVIGRLRLFVVDMFKRFKAWLLAKFSKPESLDLVQAVNEMLADNANRLAIQYISNLPEDAQEAANEVARFADGETKEFANALVNQFEGLAQSVERMEKAMVENPTHYRLAKGIVSAEDLFKQDANSAIYDLFKRCGEVGHYVINTRSEEAFMQGLRRSNTIIVELEDFLKGMVINTEASSEHGDDKAVSFDKLYENIGKVAQDMKRVSVQNQVKEFATSVDEIVRMAEQNGFDVILERLPQSLSEEQRDEFARDIAKFFRLVSKLGQEVLRLWKVRADGVASINQVGNALLSLVEGFKKAVVAAASTLDEGQKAQIAKALTGKGLKVVF